MKTISSVRFNRPTESIQLQYADGSQHNCTRKELFREFGPAQYERVMCAALRAPGNWRTVDYPAPRSM